VGAKPYEHPPLRTTKRGKVLFDEKQVWVDNMSLLWVIRSIETKNKGKRNERVRIYIGPFDAEPFVLHSLAESTFRRLMRVWDVESKEREEAYQEWMTECEDKNLDPESGKPR